VMPVTARSVQHVQINSGQSIVSEDIVLAGARYVGILAPTLTSCQLFMQTNYDQTSGGFLRVFDQDGAAEWSWDVGVGSVAAVFQNAVNPFPFARLESSVIQTDVRSFAFVMRG